MPYTKVRGLNEYMTDELLKIPPPFYGINVIDVTDVDLFTERMTRVRQWFAALDGFRPHLRATTSYGRLTRMLVVNLYGAELDAERLRRMLADPAYLHDWIPALEVADAWEFFTAPEA